MRRLPRPPRRFPGPPAEAPPDPCGHPEITFEIEIDNRDQCGKQRRTATEQMVATVPGATTTFRSVKNKHKTGNDALIITVTAPRGVDVILQSRLDNSNKHLSTQVEGAKAAGKEKGLKATELQKYWKGQTRQWIEEEGADRAWKMAGNAPRRDVCEQHFNF